MPGPRNVAGRQPNSFQLEWMSQAFPTSTPARIDYVGSSHPPTPQMANSTALLVRCPPSTSGGSQQARYLPRCLRAFIPYLTRPCGCFVSPSPLCTKWYLRQVPDSSQRGAQASLLLVWSLPTSLPGYCQVSISLRYQSPIEPTYITSLSAQLASYRYFASSF